MSCVNGNVLGSRIHRTSSKIGAFISRKRKERNLLTQGNEGNLIFYLYEHPGASAKELQEKFHLSKATVSSSLKNREKKGLLTREVEENNRKAKRIALTQRGKESCVPYTDFFIWLTDTLEKGISEEEKHTTLKVLNHILNNREEDERRLKNEHH